MINLKSRIKFKELIRRCWETNKLRTMYLIYQLTLLIILGYLRPGRLWPISLFKSYCKRKSDIVEPNGNRIDFMGCETRSGLEAMVRPYVLRAMDIYRWDDKHPKSGTFKEIDSVGVHFDFDTDVNRVVITIRGSSNLENWADNLDMSLVRSAVGTKCVHGEYLRIARDIFNEYVLLAGEHNVDLIDVDLVICGHSMGGAIASLLGSIINDSWASDVKVINVGGPAFSTGTLDFDNIINIIDVSDPIPYLPVATLSRHYNHHGVRFLINGSIGHHAMLAESNLSDIYNSAWLLDRDLDFDAHVSYALYFSK